MSRLPDAVVRYAAHDDGVLDVHLPAGGGTAPVLVLVHGGFWKQAYDRVHTRPAAEALAAEGFVVATPEYRRVGGGGGWPTTAADVDAAVAAIPGLLRGLGVATSGTTVVGHSAGGHLVLWLANQGHELDLVVGLAPVADLRAAARLGLGGGATQALLGGEPDDVPDAYAAADPMTRLAAQPRCPVRVVHGTEDEDVPLSVSRGLAAAHPFVSLDVVAGAGHMDLVDPGSAAWPAVLHALGRR
ncbi:alpha/beta hydrolase family protein [Nocardioides pakistanensis]